jgi:hypothetical protein
MKLKIRETRVIISSRKTNGLYYVYKIQDSSITCTDTIKHLVIQLDSKLHFHTHVYYIFPQSLSTSGLIRTLTYSFPTLDSLLLLYATFLTPKLQYAAVERNSVTSTDVRKLECIQHKFAALH